MKTITYTALTAQNFHENSLDNFIRHQVVAEIWQKNEQGQLALVPNAFVENWDLPKLREVANEILEIIFGNGFAYGAFCENQVVGLLLISGERFGSRNQYVQLVNFQVSEPFRRLGIGRELFTRGAHRAKELAAEKLYISAHPSKESQAAYRKLGCVEAKEINQTIAENEPFDVQMEFTL